MKKFVSIVLILTMAVSLAGVSAFATPIDINKECMHLNDMLEHGYWTNGKKPVCDCDSCQVVLADYDHLDQVFDKENANMFFKDILDRFNMYTENEAWKEGNYLLMSCDRKNGSNYISFNKKFRDFNFENLTPEQQKTYGENFKNFGNTIETIQSGDKSDERAAQIIEGIKEMQEKCPRVENTANKTKLAVIFLGGAASLASFIMGMKKAMKIPVPNYVEHPGAKVTLKDAIQTSKIGSIIFGLMLASGGIILGAFKLGDYIKDKIMNNHQCPSIEDLSKNYFQYK